jgi:hypothetical protein
MANTQHECSHRSCTAHGTNYVMFTAVFTNPNADAFRVRIRRDFYEFQSYVATDVWTSNGWQELLVEGINNYPDLEKVHSCSGSSVLLPVFDKVAEQAASGAASVTARMPLAFTGT